MNKLYLLILFTAMGILSVGTAKAAWTVVYNPYTKQTTVVYVPDAPRPCPNNHYNPYNPYYPSYRPYQPYGPSYQFNFNKSHNHGGKNHGGHGHGKKHCK